MEEVLRGRLDTIRKLERTPRAPEAYADFLLAYQVLQKFNVLPYDAAAETFFQALPAKIKQKGTHDCRIAAVAAVNDLIVITANTAHFSAIPGISHEDWTR